METQAAGSVCPGKMTIQRSMKNAKIFWIIAAVISGRPNFAWKWRSEDGTGESSAGFAYFIECLEDARQHGYRPRIDG